MLLHRYASEFTDDGSRSLLPIIRMGLGVTTAINRWMGSSLGDAASAASSWLAVTGATHFAQANAAFQPTVQTSNTVKHLRFDGVDDVLITPTWVGYTGPKAITFVLRVKALTAGKCVVMFGGGMLEIDPSGVLRCWWNSSAADGGAVTGQPRFLSPQVLDVNKFVVVTVVAPTDLDNHELSVGKTHARDTGGRTKLGVSQISLGGIAGNQSNIDVVDVIGWDHALTRAEREILVDSYKAIYPELTFM